MLGIAILTLWVALAGCSIRDLSARAASSLTVRRRTRQDPWLEGTLRAAFAEFDRELALILHERSYAAPAAKPRPRFPQDPEPPGR